MQLLLDSDVDYSMDVTTRTGACTLNNMNFVTHTMHLKCSCIQLQIVHSYK